MAAVRQASEQYNSQLKDKIHRKLEVSQEKRELQMKVVQDRLREHVSLCLTRTEVRTCTLKRGSLANVLLHKTVF